MNPRKIEIFGQIWPNYWVWVMAWKCQGCFLAEFHQNLAKFLFLTRFIMVHKIIIMLIWSILHHNWLVFLIFPNFWKKIPKLEFFKSRLSHKRIRKVVLRSNGVILRSWNYQDYLILSFFWKWYTLDRDGLAAYALGRFLSTGSALEIDNYSQHDIKSLIL